MGLEEAQPIPILYPNLEHSKNNSNKKVDAFGVCSNEFYVKYSTILPSELKLRKILIK